MTDEVDLVEIHKLLPAFKKKFLYGTVEPGKWGIQYKGCVDFERQVEYDNMKSTLTDSRWLDHFSGKIWSSEHWNKKRKEWVPDVRASLGIFLEFKDKRVKCFCADLDTVENVAACREKLLPVYEKHGIEYIWEYGGASGEKAHLWFFCNTSNRLLTRFMNVLWKEADIDPHLTGLKIELYPTHKPNFLLRVPGGIHLKSGQRMPIEFRGELIKTPTGIMKAIIDCKPVEETYMVSVLADQIDFTEVVSDPKNILSSMNRSNYNRKAYSGTPTPARKTEYQYRKLDLPHPCKDGPEIFVRLADECPAFNYLINKSEPEERGGQSYLEETGYDVHMFGLYMHNLFDLDLHRMRYRDPDNLPVLEEYVENWFNERRLRDPSGHNWEYQGDAWSGHRIPGCEAMERDFKICKGCPHKGRTGFTNPVELFYDSEPLKLQFDNEVQVDTNENIARESQKEADELISYALRNNQKLNLSLRTGQGTFKSTYISRRAARFAAAGHNVLIACSTGKLAMEMKKRIEDDHGQEVFVVMSHKNLFKYFEQLIECPFYDDIQKWVDIGVSKRSITANYCDDCEHRRVCPFPDQYTNSVDSRARIVIVQHAHFRSKQAMAAILKKKFKIMYVDETFLDSTYTFVRITPLEKRFLQKLGGRYKQIWARQIHSWIQGNVPKGKIELSVEFMEKLKDIYDKRKVPWNLPLYIDHYNRGTLYEKDVGLFEFHPVPFVPVRVLTDATQLVEYIKIILNVDDIKVVGRKVLTDVTLYNPRNEMIKVVDGSTSRASLSDTTRFQKILRFIGYMSRTEYKDLTIMVTVYESDIKRVRAFFDEYYPEQASRITVASMAVGTNEYRDINVQFQLCGVHFNLKTIKQIEWRVNNILNYWRVRNGQEEVENPYPHFVKDYTKSRFDEEVLVPVQVKMLDPRGEKLQFDEQQKRWLPKLIDSVKRRKGFVVKIMNILLKRPFAFGEEMAYMMSLGKTQQGRRIRVYWKTIKDKKEVSPLAVFREVGGKLQASDIKIYWNFSKRYEPGSLFTRICLENEVFALADLNGEVIDEKSKKKQG